jgi:hypothetical protein
MFGTKRTALLTLGCVAAVATTTLMSAGLGAQDRPPAGFAGNKVTPLLRMDLSGVPNRQVIANLYEVPAGAMVPRHFHQYVEREKWHGGRVVGAEPMRLLGVMIVEKDKPLIELAH